MDVSGMAHTAHTGDYSPLDAARVLGVSRGTIWNLIRDGKLPSYAPTGPNGLRRIRVEAVQALRRGKTPSRRCGWPTGPSPHAPLSRGGHNA